MQFQAARPFEARLDKDGVHRRDKSGGTNLPLYAVKLVAWSDADADAETILGRYGSGCGTVPGMSAERVTVELDATTAAMLRRRCMARGGSLAAAAAEQLAEDARRELLGGLPAWYACHEAEVLTAVEDGEAALSEAV